MKKLLLIHQGLANLPELDAYSQYFSKKYIVKVVHYDKIKNISKFKNTILWYFMGFYPKKIKADFIIHDYRSLSTGIWGSKHLKDKIKKHFNHKPDLRIFLNHHVRDLMNFKDKTPNTLLDMGIPVEKIVASQKKTGKDFSKKYTFGYLGATTKSRKTDTMLESFLKNYSNTNHKFLVVGQVDKEIYNKFKHSTQITFTGKLTQEKALYEISKAKIGVCFLPDVYPYRLQTPTKLMEYIALGMPVIVNNIPSINETLKKLKIKQKNIIQTDTVGIPKAEKITDIINLKKEIITAVALSSFSWKHIIDKSNINKILTKIQ